MVVSQYYPRAVKDYACWLGSGWPEGTLTKVSVRPRHAVIMPLDRIELVVEFSSDVRFAEESGCHVGGIERTCY